MKYGILLGLIRMATGLDKAESDVILDYLYNMYEYNVGIQVRFR